MQYKQMYEMNASKGGRGTAEGTIGEGEGGGGIPLLNQLVSAADELQLVQVIEFVDNFGAKKPSCTAWADLPCVDVFRIRPNEIAERTLNRMNMREIGGDWRS
jgi:hypothetical protein